MNVTVKKAFVAKQRLRTVKVADLVEYKLMGMHVHLLVPGTTPVVMTRQEFSERLSDGTLQAV